MWQAVQPTAVAATLTRSSVVACGEERCWEDNRSVDPNRPYQGEWW
jgi:hypothetical protein